MKKIRIYSDENQAIDGISIMSQGHYDYTYNERKTRFFGSNEVTLGAELILDPSRNQGQITGLSYRKSSGWIENSLMSRESSFVIMYSSWISCMLHTVDLHTVCISDIFKDPLQQSSQMQYVD